MIKSAFESVNEACVDLFEKKKIRVLHVDDDSEFLAVAKQCLEEQGQLQVDTALSAEEALEKLRNSEYDAIIADYQMPGKNGLELLKELRQEGKNVPLILFTCKGKEEVAIEAMNSGVERYIDKQGNVETTYEILKHSICSAVKRQRTEKRLKESENLLSQITDNMQDMLSITDVDLKFTYASSSHKWILGYEPNEMLGKPIHQYIHPDDLEAAMKAIQKAAEKRSGEKIEVRVKHADGHYLSLEVIEKVLTDDDGQFVGTMLTSRDITERKEAEKKILKASEEWRNTFDALSDFVFILDREQKFVRVNKTVCDFLKKEPEELIGKHCYEVLHGTDKPLPTCPCKEMLLTGRAVTTEVDDPNSGMSFLLTVSPFLDDKGEHIGCVHVAKDITERKKAEEKLRFLKEFNERIVDSIGDALLVIDPDDFTIKSVNETALKQLKLRREDVIGKTCYKITHHSLTPCKSPYHVCPVQETLKTGKPVTVEHTHCDKDNSEIYVEVTAHPVRNREGNIIQVLHLARDITERKRNYEKIGFQARLLNAVGQAIVATDIKGNITYWNFAAEQLYGWTETEVLGRNILDVTPAETSREQAENILKKLIAGESWSGEFLAKRRDGTAFPAIVTDAPITNDKGEFIGIIGVSTDITEQKWMQEVFGEAITKVAELNEKLRVVESLTRHDLRNKLAALNGLVYILKKRYGENQEAQQHLRDIELVAQQMLRILEFERIYSQVGAEELEYINVEQHLTEAISLFSDLKGAILINDCHGLTVFADSLLRQLFYNLIDNSLKYGEKTSKIRVHYEVEKDQVKLIYDDDGVGIPEEMRNDLFSEGFGKGTGYGLYLIKRICEAYGWTILETGKQGQGVQFTMVIPEKGKEGKSNYEIS